MLIRDMFADNINRKINGVIKVDQATEEVIEQELSEYIVTKELKKHFIDFFNFYSDAFNHVEGDTGIWISGFFGSGKSHFLKMLSYLLENKEVNGVRSVERFRAKFADDPATFMMIEQSTKAETETILFNIDVEGPINKDKTAVMRVFAKMFYNHLGYYGENLKVAMLERYLDQIGKTEEFRSVFASKKGSDWVDNRRAIAFNGKYVIPTLMEVLDMSEDDAKNWFADKSATDLSIALLIEDIKDYLSKKPANFRLLFMVDEVGQYVGTDKDMLLNLQSLIEKIGTDCGGKVWIACTGQEALDDIIKVRTDEFSRILGRFKTRLTLSSTAADEVIQKRILKKNNVAEKLLENVYDKNDSVLRNIFSFTDSISDIKGYRGPEEFTVNFPFVPYQFIILQKVFSEIRKHGNSGKHLSGGERSMLSGFQEAAQKIQEQNEFALVPFYHFYDTVHTFLDSSIRRVIERCEKAADNNDGLEAMDVNVLKLLYMIRYIDDIPANLDNIVILMADDIRMDKIDMREKMRNSLNRLLSQNYISRTGEVYSFLTDEEQDIQREIKNTPVDTAAIVEGIGRIIFGDIFTTKKYRYKNYDFAFDQMVDGTAIGNVTGGMCLQFLTVATDETDKSELRLTTGSKDNLAIVVLGDNNYFESMENAMKIRKYVKQRNISQLSKSVQDIIKNQQDEATRYEESAKNAIEKAIESGRFYADGECLEIKAGNAKNKIEQALEYLVENIYYGLGLIEKSVGADADIKAILIGTDGVIKGMEPNLEAVAKVEEYLTMRDMKKLPTYMSDIQSRYSAIPYGWKEIDIAAVVARLIREQKVTIKYAGETIQANNPKLVDMLRKKSEIGKTVICKRQMVTLAKISAIRGLLRDYLDRMDIPDDEDTLVTFIIDEFTKIKDHYENINSRYVAYDYPDHELVEKSIKNITDILSCKKENRALIEAIIDAEDELFDLKEDMENVEAFFKNQVEIFDKAVSMQQNLQDEIVYLKGDREAFEALEELNSLISGDQQAKEIYRSIPKLNGLMKKIKDGYETILSSKKEGLLDCVGQCLDAIDIAASGHEACATIVKDAETYFGDMKLKIAGMNSIAMMESLTSQMVKQKDYSCSLIEQVKQPPKPVTPSKPQAVPKPGAKKTKGVDRRIAFPAKTLASQEDVEAYLEVVKGQLMDILKEYDEIKIN